MGMLKEKINMYELKISSTSGTGHVPFTVCSDDIRHMVRNPISFLLPYKRCSQLVRLDNRNVAGDDRQENIGRYGRQTKISKRGVVVASQCPEQAFSVSEWNTVVSTIPHSLSEKCLRFVLFWHVEPVFDGSKCEAV